MFLGVAQRLSSKPRCRRPEWPTQIVRVSEGSVEVRWHPALLPFLFGLRKEFTTYKLKHAAAFRSIYSWRIFECLKSWQGAGRWTPTITGFRDAMDASPKHRANFKALRERVIEPAVKELREKRRLILCGKL